MNKRFSIIDGSGFLFRAYYGVPELLGADGANTNVLFGFAKMFFTLLLTKPDYIAIARDAPHRTVRHAMAPDYKGNRVQTPEDLGYQIGATKQMIADLGIPVFQYPGYEADDIIATRATKAYTKPLILTQIYSSDKDLKQLINERTTQTDTMKHKTTTYDDFVAEYGFEPIYMSYYLALIGDTSDNIQGVTGIGPKTASALISQYQTLDGIYTALDAGQLKPSIAAKLIAGRETAYHAYTLTRLIYDVPDMETLDIASSCTWQFDFSIMRYILLDVNHFESLAPLIDRLEKIYTKPVSESLFG